MMQVYLVITIPKFKFKVASILCFVFDRNKYFVRESDDKIFAGDGEYLLTFCRLKWLSNTKVYYRTWRSLYKANHYIVVYTGIDREHDLMIADIIFPVKNSCIDSISLRVDLCGEFDRAAGRASWTSEVF